MDWKTEMAAFVEARLNQPFKWGESDCCLFSADAVKLLGGFDIAEWFRGRYTNEKEAYDLLVEHAGGGISKTITKLARQYKMTKVNNKFVQNGDICLAETPRGDALAIVWNGKVVSQGDHKLIFLPKAAIKRAWRYKKTGE
jgi:hypothetical protein